MRLRYLVLVAALFLPSAGKADDAEPWRISAYGGVATRLDTTDIFLHGHFHPDGSQIGISLDRDLADLGSGFTLVGEASSTHFVAKSDETSLELGLGIRYAFRLFGDPVSVSGFTGPSWASDEPVIPTGTFHGVHINYKRVPWLNYVGAEIAIGIAPEWNGVVRYYHRSGAFGLFEPNADEGSTLGFGLQYHF
jgi:hypothetical protein